jgi:hypothetical protein
MEDVALATPSPEQCTSASLVRVDLTSFDPFKSILIVPQLQLGRYSDDIGAETRFGFRQRGLLY